MRQIYPVRGPEWAVTPKASAGPLPDAVAELARLYAARAEPSAAGLPWLRANMVTSTDGAAALDGVSGGLSGSADRMVFTVLRSLADVILVGAGTARAERYRPVAAGQLWAALRPDGAPVPPLAIVTGSLDLDSGSRLLTGTAPQASTILITTEAAPPDRKAALAGRARIIEAGHDRVDAAAAVAALSDLGYRHVLAEGGPSLLGQLAQAGRLDELCLTISPVLAGGSAGRIVRSPASIAGQLTLAHILADKDFLLCRYLRQLSPQSGEE